MTTTHELRQRLDGYHISPPGNPMKGNDLEEDWQKDGETN